MHEEKYCLCHYCSKNLCDAKANGITKDTSSENNKFMVDCDGKIIGCSEDFSEIKSWQRRAAEKIVDIFWDKGITTIEMKRIEDIIDDCFNSTLDIR